MSTGRTFGRNPDVKKRTTQVNIYMVVGVIIFFALGAAGIYWVWQNSSA